MKGFPRLGTLIGMLILSIMVLSIPQGMAQAQGCSISKFESSHYGQVSLGTWIVLKGESNCGTVRYTVNGAPRAEIGNGSQTEVIKTEEFGTGTFELCFVGRGDGGWENATRSCTSIYVQGSQGAPPGSSSGGNVKCWVNNFSVTPATVKKGQTVNFSGYGQCDGNARAARFYISGNPYGEYGGNTTNATWNTSNAGIGTYEICFGITGGEWLQEARSCVNLNVLAPDAPPPTPSSSQGPQSDNGQRGQTDQSGPNNAGNPQTQPQQPAQPSNPPQGNNSGGNQGGSGGGSGNCPTNLSRLSVGSIAKINDTDPSPAKVRSGPGTGHAHIDNRAVRTLVTIIGGPACGNGWVWWEVGYDGKSGWIAEVDSRRLYNLVPNGSAPSSQGNTGGNTGSNSGSGSSNPRPSSPPTGGRPQTCPSVPARLSTGQSGRNIIDGRGSTNVRQTPGGYLVTQMAEGTTFTVIDGPFCLRADNGQAIRWFKIRMDNGTEGWAPEAVNNRYVLEPWGGETEIPSPAPLGKGCWVNNIGTVTCKALIVYTPTDTRGLLRDPYIGIFEIPSGYAEKVSYITFSGTDGTILNGFGHCGGFPPTEQLSARPGYELIMGCVGRIEFYRAGRIGQQNPENWELVYRK